VRERPQRDDGVRASRDERRGAKSAEELDSRAADERAERGVDGPDAITDAQQGAVDGLDGEFASGGDGALETPDATEPTPSGAESARTKSSGASAAATNTETGAAANSTSAGASEGAPSTAAELLQALNSARGEAAAGAAGAASDKRGAAGAATDASGAAATLEHAYSTSEATLDSALESAAAAEAESPDPSNGAKLATAGEGEFNLAKLAGSKGGESALPSDAARAPGAVEPSARNAANAEVQAPEAKLGTAHAALDAEGAADVLRQVRLRLSPEMRQAVIQLEPRELGRIAIRISVTRGVVRAELRAENATTLEALERHAPELKAALERVGLGAEGFALQLGFDDGPAHRDGFGAASRDPHNTSARAPALERELPDHQMRSLAQRLAAAGGVDTYA
jgi:flagellar hook-length control protein FliK